jgi:hypothetical protein
MLVASKKARAVVKDMFTDALASLPIGRDDESRILDVGCGLGFLSCVRAEFYMNARITGIDTFEHVSLKRSSLERKRTREFLASRTGSISRKVTCLGSHLPKSSTSSSLTSCFRGGKMPFKATFIVDTGRLRHMQRYLRSVFLKNKNNHGVTSKAPIDVLTDIYTERGIFAGCVRYYLSVAINKGKIPNCRTFRKFREYGIGNHGFLNKRVRYAIKSATAKYPIIVTKLAIVEAMKAW